MYFYKIIVYNFISVFSYIFLYKLFKFKVIYDGEGEIVKWIIVSDGKTLPHEWTQSQDCDALFLISEDGTMNSTVLRNALITINRYSIY